MVREIEIVIDVGWRGGKLVGSFVARVFVKEHHDYCFSFRDSLFSLHSF